MEEFNYVIARMWFEDSNELDCYAIHNTIFYGTMEDAEAQLEFIKGRVDENEADEYRIYKVEDKPIK